MKVLKFGGTSLGDAGRMKNVAEIVSRQGRVVVVLSAIAGTTDSLVKIAEAYKHGELNQVKSIVEVLLKHYQRYVDNLFEQESNKQTAMTFVESQFAELVEANIETATSAIEFHILAKGEVISTELFALYCEENGLNAKLLYSLDFLRLTQENSPDEAYLSEHLNRILTGHENTDIFVAQGFICRNAFGEVSNLKRGGSDYSASLFGAAINAQEVQIWTDIDGMHNNDPRFVKNTTPIRELSFDEAAELAYFGAKILHPSSIKPARRKNIPVRLLNTLQPDATGTLISSESNNANIKAVAAKSGITAIKIRSSEMLQAPGFLRRVFEVFELYHTSIDVITTSEVAVSVTIDDTTYLESIVKTLNEFGNVDVDENLSIICVVGDFVAESTGIASRVIRALEAFPIRMISYGGSAHNITLLISEDVRVKALQALHEGLFDV
ncbi:aspartate kinase [Aliikangiella marina]|uniref:Aspartokinase n=1 Tax=Aliikangiella marina TaxID=1712262 RepID=A0A545T2D7_9GAMM|nr:aspartate kinase [Aliikangiella marina]TQV71369.1 aspartate kinase [Aliikangiella marina]